MLSHPIPPLYDEHSKILILGSFPSVKSREQQFFYGHKQNRFWRVLAQVLECETPTDIQQKKAMLIGNHIAVWDVISACDIEGSSDSSIKNVIANDIAGLVQGSGIEKIYGNGEKACRLYDKYCKGKAKKEIIKLPSTSPANAAYSMEKLIEHWQIIKKDVDCG